jgi:hypothetical protein
VSPHLQCIFPGFFSSVVEPSQLKEERVCKVSHEIHCNIKFLDMLRVKLSWFLSTVSSRCLVGGGKAPCILCWINVSYQLYALAPLLPNRSPRTLSVLYITTLITGTEKFRRLQMTLFRERSCNLTVFVWVCRLTCCRHSAIPFSFCPNHPPPPNNTSRLHFTDICVMYH